MQMLPGRFLTKDKSFYHQLLTIGIPVTLQGFVSFGVFLSDALMIGRLGEIELSAVAMANQLGFLLFTFAFGVSSGANVLIAQYWGRQDRKSVQKIATLMYRILLVGTLLFTVLALCFPRAIMSAFTPDQLVIETGVEFLRIVGWSYLALGISTANITMLRSVGIVKISLAASIVSLIASVFFNWVLIFGNLGAPALGVVGCAIAVCIARGLEAVIMLVYMAFFEKKICYRFKMLFAGRLDSLRSYMRNAVPVIVTEMIWAFGVAVLALIVARIAIEFTAASTILHTLTQFVTVFIYGLANASAVIVGNKVGAGEYNKAEEYAKSLMFIAFLLGIATSAVILLLRVPVLAVYNVSDRTSHYASQIIIIHAVVTIFASMAATSLMGVLRGGGDTRFVLILDGLVLWCVSIAMGAIAGLYLQLPVWIVYIVMKLDEPIKVFFVMRRFKGKKWIHDVTREKTKENL